MGQTTSTRTIVDTPLACWLDVALVERGWGVRTLAKRMNALAPAVEVDNARRALNRYLFEGSSPEGENRTLLARALDVEEASLPAQDVPFRGSAPPIR